MWEGVSAALSPSQAESVKAAIENDAARIGDADCATVKGEKFDFDDAEACGGYFRAHPGYQA